MKYDFIKTSWFNGEWLLWNDYFYNAGNSYSAYRLGPIILRIYHENTKT